jgi:hypothetical protein
VLRPPGRSTSRPTSRRLIAVLGGAILVAAGVGAVLPQAAGAADRSTVMRSAAAYGTAHKYKIGIAVYDTKTNRVYGSGSSRSTFASESVIKAMIATRLILQGRMRGQTARRAYKMITQSDDAIASAFYGSVGGDGLINWIKRHYHVPDLGSPPHRAGWWGNTHITPLGLVKFYAKLKSDKRVGPWLLNAMHHARKYGSDGTYQFFGLPSATQGAAVKQGWGLDYDDWGRSADFNSTGFVNSDRYAVAILARGPSRTYGGAIGNALTQTARRLLPGGRFPDPDPVIQHMTRRTGQTTGGLRITVRGTDFTHASAVYFGAVKGRSLHVVSSTELMITQPPHSPGKVSVRVVTDHGTSTPHSYFIFVRPPTVTSVGPTSGPDTGGTTVTVRGTDFTRVFSVWFGNTPARKYTLSSSTLLTAVAPAGVAGSVPISVHTLYGRSPAGPGAAFSYLPPPSASGISPVTGPVAGGEVVTITGTGLSSVTGVLFGGRAGTDLRVVSPTSLAVVAPAGTGGQVDVVLQSRYGSSIAPPAARFTYAD